MLAISFLRDTHRRPHYSSIGVQGLVNAYLLSSVVVDVFPLPGGVEGGSPGWLTLLLYSCLLHILLCKEMISQI